MGIFDLLDLADGASGDEAVARVVKKVVPPDDPNKPPKNAKKKGAAVAPANDDLPPPPQHQHQHHQHQQQQHHHHQQHQQHYPQEREDNYGGGRGRGQAFHGGRQGPAYPRGRGRGAGDNRVIIDANGDRFCYYGHERVFLGNINDRPYYNNGGYNGNGAGYNQNRGQYQQDGDSNYRNGGRQNLQYRPKSKPSSVAASEGDHKSEGNVEPVAEAKQVEATPAENVVEAVPASESDKSTGDVQKVESKTEGAEGAENKPVGEGAENKPEGEGAENKPEGEAAKKKEDKQKTKLLSGSAKRKLKKLKPKKEDSNGDASIETAEKEQEAPIEEEKIEMTLEEYEKMQGKKKSLESSKPEERKVAAVAFEGLQLLEKKKIEDDDRLKAKAKEAAAKEAKPRKAITIQEYLKPKDGSEYVTPVAPPPPRGPYRGGRGNGTYGRSSRDNSSEPRIYNSAHGENAILFHNVGGNGSAAPRSGEVNNVERPDGGYPRGGYNGGRGNGRYQERQDGYNGERREQQGGYNGGRGNGRYQERQDGYNGERRDQQGGYNGGNGRYQERHDGGYNGERQDQLGGYNGGQGNGGNQDRRQGGYNGGRGNGGYQDGYNGDRRQQGGYNGGRGYGGYQQGNNYRQRQAPKKEVVMTAADFPALGGASQAQPASQSQAQA